MPRHSLSHWLLIVSIKFVGSAGLRVSLTSLPGYIEKVIMSTAYMVHVHVHVHCERRPGSWFYKQCSR